ncbi:phytoene desaturase family protein [Salinifilum ghardaiensis]
MSVERFDVAVVGGGPNGLTCAAYLARAGARVAVLDQRFEWGGSMTTDDFATPYHYNLGQYLLPLGAELPPYTDLDLRSQAVGLLEPDPVVAFVPERGGEPLIIGRGGAGLGEQLPRMLDAAAESILPLLYAGPAPVEEVERLLEANQASTAVELARLGPTGIADLVPDTRGKAAIRYLCGLAGFFDPGEPLGLMGVFCLARLLRPTIVVGGTASLTAALFRAGARAGVQYRTVADVHRIDVVENEGHAHCRDGREVVASSVVCALDPKTTFLELLDQQVVPDDIRRAAMAWKLDGAGAFTAHFGVKGDPPGRSRGEAGRALIQVLGFADEAAVVDHFDAVLHGRMPASPAGHLSVTTVHDPAQCASGPYGPLHTLRFETPAPPAPAVGEWNRRTTAEYRAKCWEFIGERTTGDRPGALFAFADSPVDLEHRFRTTRNGSFRQGSLVREQTFTQRPHSACSGGRTPITGLYLAGGGVHPGIPGSLAAGYHTAAVVCADRGYFRWWAEPDFMTRAREAGRIPQEATTG